MTAETLDDRLAKIRDRTSRVLAMASPSPDLMRANEAVHHTLAVLLARHEPAGVYGGAEDCAHPEPSGHAGLQAWETDHPYGEGDVGRICRISEIGTYCPACTELAYDEDYPVGDDYVSAASCLVRPLIEQVMGERVPVGA